MTVKELFQSLDFKDIIEPLVLKIPRCSETHFGVQRKL